MKPRHTRAPWAIGLAPSRVKKRLPVAPTCEYFFEGASRMRTLVAITPAIVSFAMFPTAT